MRAGRAPHCEQHPCLIYTAHPSEVMGAKPRPGGEAPQHGGETPKDVHTGKWKVGKIQTGNSRTGAPGTAGSHHLPPAASGGSGRAAPRAQQAFGRAGSLSQLHVPILGSQHPHHNQVPSAPSQAEGRGGSATPGASPPPATKAAVPDGDGKCPGHLFIPALGDLFPPFVTHFGCRLPALAPRHVPGSEVMDSTAGRISPVGLGVGGLLARCHGVGRARG